jgi:type I restriction enzyme M protein
LYALKCFSYEDLAKRDKANLDIFWLRDDSLEDSANLPDPEVIAVEIAEDLKAALDRFASISVDLKRDVTEFKPTIRRQINLEKAS